MPTAEVLRLKAERKAAASVSVPPELWEGLQVIQRCQTQWRLIAGLGGARLAGLDYSGVETVMRHMPLNDKNAAFESVQVIESEMLSIQK